MRRARRSPGGAGGFTLLELLVVIGLLGVVTTWGYVILFRVDSEWRDLRRRTELSAAADELIESLRRDVEDVISPKLTSVPLVGIAKLHSDATRLHELFDDALILPVRPSAGAAGSSEAMRVRYHVVRDGARDLLVRDMGPLTGEVLPAAGRLSVAQNADVVKLRFEYALDNHGYEWVTGWNRPDLPEAIRISLTVADPNDATIQLSRKAVFDVRVE
jgi:prepilin-type N-terminal cleavage/methylation domain-containing protein